ncbi:MAG: PAS domain S-box protein [Mangrovibacterium sp.]
MVLSILKKYIAGLLGKKRENDNNANAGRENNDDLDLLRNLIDRTNDLIEVLDPETGRFLYVNEKGCRDLGYSREELLKLTVFDIDPLIDPPLLKQITEEISAENNKIWEGIHLRKDGSTFPVEVNIKMAVIGRKYLIAVARDTTARKQEEEEIKNERKLLRTLIDHLPYPIYFKDREARKIIANLADVENIGCANEAEALGKTDMELFEGEVGLRGYTDDLKVLETGLPILNQEEAFSDKSTGLQRWLLTSKIPLFDENGNTTGLVGIGRDITYRKKAEKQIQKLTKSVEQSPSSIIITDVSGLIEYVNPKFLEITGYNKEDIVGKNPRILKSGKMPDEVYRQLWETIMSGKIWRGELVNRKKNGELYWEWVTVTSIKDEAGQITNFIAIKEDISARKQMETDLIKAKEKAEESDRLKSAFLANMSHEILTPLNSIIGFSELLQDDDFNDQQKKEFLSHVIDNGNSLLSIVSDIMDISKIESGQIELRKTPVPVKEFLSKLIERSKILLGEKKLEFWIDTNSEDCTITTDQERLNQVFNNLISNAVKFTDQGYIQVGYRNEGDRVTFYVKDTGIGIPEEFHEIIFERFRQIETEKNRKYGGNGLGLAIAGSLVEMMGGKIWLDSSPGKGSVFYFSIPRNQVSNDNLHDQ